MIARQFPNPESLIISLVPPKIIFRAEIHRYLNLTKSPAASVLLAGVPGASRNRLTEAKKPRHLSLRLGLVRALTVEHWAYLVKMQYQRSLPREFTLLLFVRLAYIERGPGRRFLMIPEGVVKRLERTKKSDVTHERVNE